ncbi:unnamed protein product, partial [Brassica rapa]
DEDENNRQKSITVKGEIKRRSDTVNSNRRREERSGSVTRTPSRVKPETELFVTARERFQETEIGEGETLRNDVVRDDDRRWWRICLRCRSRWG